MAATDWTAIMEISTFLVCFYDCLTKVVMSIHVIPKLAFFLVINFAGAIYYVIYVRKGRLEFVRLEHEANTEQL
jgi:hypothetical protein